MQTPHVLVLGGYGLIGSGIARHLHGKGYKVRASGRSAVTGAQVLPDVEFAQLDLNAVQSVDDWAKILQGVSHVVNCAGALQDTTQDNLEHLHHHVVSTLAKACAINGIHITQISALGADETASTLFLSSKARGDSAIVSSGAAHCILKPGVVIAPSAYGGTMLLRMLASIPFVQPVTLPTAKLQTVGLSDVAEAVELAISGKLEQGLIADLIEPKPHNLADIISHIRHWLGFTETRAIWAVPAFLTMSFSKIADGLGHLGWRSPLRSTALRVLEENVTGDTTAWNATGQPPMKPLRQTLQQMSATVEDRLFARMALLMPVLVATLSAFWLLSGVIGLAQVHQASATLTDAGWAPWLAKTSVVFWAIIDIALGMAILYRPTAKLACWGMIGVSLFYLLASSVFVPALWIDPLGPLVKVIPSITLALVTRIALETR